MFLVQILIRTEGDIMYATAIQEVKELDMKIGKY